MVQAALEPSVFQEAGARMLARIERRRLELHKIRKIVLVATLLRQHLASGDVANMLCAFASGSWGSSWPSLLRALPDVLAKTPPTFQSCEVPTRPPEPSIMTLGPHCQCAGRMDDWRKRPHAGGLPRVRVGMREVRVPKWVVADGAASVRGDGNTYWRPRKQTRSRTEVVPPGFPRQGLKWLSAHLGASGSRCQVPGVVYEIQADVDDALRCGEEFAESLKFEVSEILGSVGTNDGMASLLQAACACWDWRTLLFQRPAVHHVHALIKAYHELRPFLERTLWPVAAEFAAVERRWPEDGQMAAQYMQLASRMRAAHAAASRARRVGEPAPNRCAEHAMAWVTLKGYSVKPFRPCQAVVLAMHHFWPRGARPSAGGLTPPRAVGVLSIAARVTEFVGRCCCRRGGAWIPQCLPFEAMAERLRPPPCGQEWFRVRGDRFEPGSVLMHVSKRGKAGRLVQVLESLLEVDVAAVGASLDMCSDFALGKPLLWHVVRLHHRCRMLSPPESPCERMGSYMSMLWHPEQHAGAGAIFDRVFLSQAKVQCVGGERDEYIVREVAALMQHMRQKPICVTLQAARIPRILIDAEEELALSGRMPMVDHDESILASHDLEGVVARGGQKIFRGIRADHMRRWTPSELPSSMTEAIRSAVTCSGIVAALPTHGVGVKRARTATKSVIHEKMSKWADGAVGREWRKQRDAIFSFGIARPVADLEVEPAVATGGASASSAGSRATELEA